MEQTKGVKGYLLYQAKLFILQYAKAFKIPKQPASIGRKAGKGGAVELVQKSPITYNHPYKIKEGVIEKCFFFVKITRWFYGRSSGNIERYHCF